MLWAVREARQNEEGGIGEVAQVRAGFGYYLSSSTHHVVFISWMVLEGKREI
jgi:hypothetical protein